jgi:nucleotide-binding universal stress UspA family protein
MRETSEKKDIRMTAQRFLVPLDFSADANQALAYAIALASTLGARVTLLHVMQSPPWGGSDMDVTVPHAYSRFIQHLEAEVAHRMQACLERVTAGGLEGEMAVVHGVPFQEILDTAKKQQVDLIIMGTHGRTGLQHVLMGSVAEKVVRLAPCPVLVVRQPPLVPIS